MRLWTMRVIGALNIVFVVLGLYYATYFFVLRWGRWSTHLTQYDWDIQALFYTISLSFLAYLSYSGVRLIRGEASVLRPLGAIFILEILYFVTTVVVDWIVLPPALGKIAAGFWEDGLNPLTPQYLTAYPLVGCFVVLFLSLKKRESSVVPRQSVP